MPIYEYRCLLCDETFEQRRSLDAVDEVRCPGGHTEVKRLLSVFAGGRPAAAAPASGGGCCGGACGCG